MMGCLRLMAGAIGIGGWMAVAAHAGAGNAAGSGPNIVVIYCDDLGYGDIGPFGSKVHRTPNLDRMAAEGRCFTSFYSTSGVCTPSRSSLMTACYPRRVGLHENGGKQWVLFPGDARGLSPSEMTVAEVLKAQGYATACVGKWHLGDQPEFLPTRQGFDSFYGLPYSNDMSRRNAPLPLLRGDKVIEEEPDQAQLTPRYTKEVIDFIRNNKDGPFFVYMPHTFPHVPLFASQQFAGQSKNGKYGDAVEEIDWSVGEIFKALKELGLDEKTLVVFSSDNGAQARIGGSNGPLRGFKGETWEGGQRIPCVMRWPGRIPASTRCDALTSTIDVLPTLAYLAGGKVPSDRIIDGRNIWPLIADVPGAKSPHEAFFYYYKGNLQAVRSGSWKLVLPRVIDQRGKPKADLPESLFNLDSDIGESTNVAEHNLAVVERLKVLAEACRQDIGDDTRGRQVAGKNCREPGLAKSPNPLTHRAVELKPKPKKK